MPEGPERPLPVVDEQTAFFWGAGADGVLRVLRCGASAGLVHPPMPMCPHCRGREDAPADVSGRGTVVGCTVNHHPWDPGFPPPFSIATVALEEDDRVRLTTNVVGCDPDDVHVGMAVAVRFEQHDDVWLPLFAPTGEADAPLVADPVAPEDVWRTVRPMARQERFEERVALTGIGMSDIGRRLIRDPLSLTIDACLAAVAHTGLELDDIDGLSTYPGGEGPGGFGEGGITALEDALRIRPTWYNGGAETFGPSGSVIAAMLAVASGLCRHVLCFRTVWQATFAAQLRAGTIGGGTAANGMPAGRGRVGGFMRWTAPYGVGSAANNLALVASHHFARYGTTREALGWIAVTERAGAALNPAAIYRDPITLDDHLAARPITTPFGLLDCDAPCDAAIAVVVSARDAADDLRHPPVLVDAVGTQLIERIAWDQSTLTHEPQVLGPAAHLWTRTTLRPSDVDVALLYDGFTFNCLSWIEALGFCGIGEAGDFLAGGVNIAREGGVVAVNPHGGQLSAGRTHGMGFVHEAVVQLRRDAGARQVPDADVAVVSSGGLTPSGVMLLRRG